MDTKTGEAGGRGGVIDVSVSRDRVRTAPTRAALDITFCSEAAFLRRVGAGGYKRVCDERLNIVKVGRKTVRQSRALEMESVRR